MLGVQPGTGGNGAAGGAPADNGSPFSAQGSGPGSPSASEERQRRSGGSPPGRGPSRGRPPLAPQTPAPVEAPRTLPTPDCPVCGKPIRELASALTHRVSRQPAHFDCVVRELRESNEVAPQEKICYIGGGSFAILEFRPQGSPSRFVIRKRIPYEEKETPQEWKKPLVVCC